MSNRPLCLVCCTPVVLVSLAPGSCCPGLPWGALPLCLMVLPKFSLAQAFVPPGPRRALMRPALGQLRSFNSLPHCMGQWAVGILQYTATLQRAMSSGDPSIHCRTRVGSWQWGPLCTLPHCLGAVGSGTPSVHCLTARAQWAVKLLLCIASLLGRSGQ